MPEGETRAAGSWLGDLTNEWKTAKTPEKVIIVGAIAGTVGIALYLHGKSQTPNQPGASGLGGLPTNFQQGGGGGGGTTGTTGGGTAPISNPTQPPTSKPPTPPTTTKTGTPGPAPKPTPMYPVRPIVKQTTQATKTYAATNHAKSAPQSPHRPGGNYGIQPQKPKQGPPYIAGVTKVPQPKPISWTYTPPRTAGQTLLGIFPKPVTITPGRVRVQ